jgi:hypothetical protein
VVGCSRVGFRAAVPAPVRTSRTVRVVGADRPRGGFCLGVLRVLRVFLSAVVLIRLASGFWWKAVWRTVRAARVARGPSEDVVPTVRVWRCRLGRSVSF